MGTRSQKWAYRDRQAGADRRPLAIRKLLGSMLAAKRGLQNFLFLDLLHGIKLLSENFPGMCPRPSAHAIRGPLGVHCGVGKRFWF
jgi:hypothetical protein